MWSLGWVWVGQILVCRGGPGGGGQGTVSGDTPALSPSCFLVFQEAELLLRSRPGRDLCPVSLPTALIGPHSKAEGC